MKQNHGLKAAQFASLQSAETAAAAPINERLAQALKIVNVRDLDSSRFESEVIPAIKLLGKEGDVRAIPALEELYHHASKIKAKVGEVHTYSSPVKDLREIIKAVTLIGHRDAPQAAVKALGEMLSSAKNVTLSSLHPSEAPWSKKLLGGTDTLQIAKALATFGGAAVETLPDLKKHLNDPIYHVVHYEEEKGGVSGREGSPTRPTFEFTDVTNENRNQYQRQLNKAINEILKNETVRVHEGSSYKDSELEKVVNKFLASGIEFNLSGQWVQYRNQRDVTLRKFKFEHFSSADIGALSEQIGVHFGEHRWPGHCEVQIEIAKKSGLG